MPYNTNEPLPHGVLGWWTQISAHALLDACFHVGDDIGRQYDPHSYPTHSTVKSK
jgi:hypothetical protein